MTTNLPLSLLAAPATAGTLTAMGSTLGWPALVSCLAVLVLPVLRTVLRYRLHSKAVDKAGAQDLPALFRAFGPDPEPPEPPEPPSPPPLPLPGRGSGPRRRRRRR
ncbi:hypothetical protein ABZ721_39880 [Streptomyces sp. NPDC006733]|uniref:hypothetical protein n=1 Tax=Streptomyces sp. NPDC006733 TaxID=3155460 RepID=UPI0033CAADAA